MNELDYWTLQLKAGRISRREFMARATALGASAAVASALLPIEAVAQTPKRGGTAKFAVHDGGYIGNNDPASGPATFRGPLANSLTEIDAKGRINPDLAESFESADKAATWVFKLRKGVTFHNGKDLTAEDVVASFRYHMGPNSQSTAKSLLAGVKDIKADGKSTVVFTLDGRNADFPYLASAYHFVIMPAKPDGTADWQSNVGTGPFTLISWEPRVRARFKRNPNYFESGKPYFDEVEFIAIPDVAARMAALTTGEVDHITRPDLKTLHLLKRNPQINVTEVTSYGHYTFDMNTTVAPFDNADVRNALKWAIDRQEIAQKVFLGHGQIGNDNPISPVVKFAIDPQPRHTYDPARAKALLKKAGMENLTVNLSVADVAFPGAIDAAVLYQQSAKAAGININVVREPNDAYWTTVWGKKPFAAAFSAGRPTCDWMFSSFYAKGVPWNVTKWNHSKFNDLLTLARSETDETKRAGMYADMQQLVHDDGGTIVLMFYNIVEAASKKLAHGEIAGNLELDGSKITKRWWFA